LKLSSPPPRQHNDNFSILSEMKSCYKLWCGFLNKIPRNIRYTLATKIDNLFIEILEIALLAKFKKTEEKIVKLKILDEKLSVLKYFITILWEIKALDTNKYSLLADKLALTGRMIGGFFNKKKNS